MSSQLLNYELSKIWGTLVSNLKNLYYGQKKPELFMIILRLQLNNIDVFARTDGISVDLKVIELNNVRNRFNNVLEWYEFSVKEEENIPEAVRIASVLYKYD